MQADIRPPHVIREFLWVCSLKINNSGIIGLKRRFKRPHLLVSRAIYMYPRAQCVPHSRAPSRRYTARLARLHISLHGVYYKASCICNQTSGEEGVRPLDSQPACNAYSADAETGSDCSSASFVSLLDRLHAHWGLFQGKNMRIIKGRKKA